MNDTTKEQIGQWKQINEDLSSIVSFEKFNDTFDKTVCLFDTLGDNAMRQPIIHIMCRLFSGHNPNIKKYNRLLQTWQFLRCKCAY